MISSLGVDETDLAYGWYSKSLGDLDPQQTLVDFMRFHDDIMKFFPSRFYRVVLDVGLGGAAVPPIILTRDDFEERVPGSRLSCVESFFINSYSLVCEFEPDKRGVVRFSHAFPGEAESYSRFREMESYQTVHEGVDPGFYPDSDHI